LPSRCRHISHIIISFFTVARDTGGEGGDGPFWGWFLQETREGVLQDGPPPASGAGGNTPEKYVWEVSLDAEGGDNTASSAIEGGDLALGGMIGDPVADAAQLFEQLLKLLPLVADLAGNGVQPGQILVAQLLVQALLEVMLEALAQDLPMQGEEQMQEQMQGDEHQQGNEQDQTQGKEAGNLLLDDELPQQDGGGGEEGEFGSGVGHENEESAEEAAKSGGFQEFPFDILKGLSDRLLEAAFPFAGRAGLVEVRLKQGSRQAEGLGGQEQAVGQVLPPAREGRSGQGSDAFPGEQLMQGSGR